MHCVKRVRIRSYSGPHLSRISPHSDWIRRDTEYLSVFSPNAGKCGKNADQITPKFSHVTLQALMGSGKLKNNELMAFLTPMMCRMTYWIYVNCLEVVVQRCSTKNIFLEISQNSQDNTCARASFLIKLQVSWFNIGSMSKK